MVCLPLTFSNATPACSSSCAICIVSCGEIVWSSAPVRAMNGTLSSIEARLRPRYSSTYHRTCSRGMTTRAHHWPSRIKIERTDASSSCQSVGSSRCGFAASVVPRLAIPDSGATAGAGRATSHRGCTTNATVKLHNVCYSSIAKTCNRCKWFCGWKIG